MEKIVKAWDDKFVKTGLPRLIETHVRNSVLLWEWPATL